MEYLASILIGYLLGTINPSYILGRIKGVDIREKGSKNAGASNALIHFGKLWGVLCALLDIAKSCLAIGICTDLFPYAHSLLPIVGTACIVGHVYPFYMNFRGGKGLACFGGIVLTFDWRVFLIMLGCAIVLALISDYLFLVSVIASIVFPIIYTVMTQDFLGGAVLLIITVLITWKHKINFYRMRQGTEIRLSFLWKKDKEIERIEQNVNKL